MKGKKNLRESLAVLLRTLRLPTFYAMYAETAAQAEKQGWSFETYLHHLASAELEDRKQRKIASNLKQAKIPKDKTMAILGYGSQGHGHAQNLRDSGCNVVVAELKGTPNYEQAVKDGFQPLTTEEAVKQGDLICVIK